MTTEAPINPADAKPEAPLGGTTAPHGGLPENDNPDPNGAAKAGIDYSGFDKAADAELEKLLGKEPEPIKYPWEETPNPEAKDAVQAGTQGTAEGEREGEKPGAPVPEKAQEKKPEPPDREMREKIVTAKRALGRTGLYTETEIDSMSEDTLLKKGGHAAAQQANTDRMQKDMLRYKAMTKGQTTPEDQSPDNPPGRSGEGDSQADSEGAARPTDSIDQLVKDGLIDASVADRIKESHRSMNQKVAAAQRAAVTTRFAATVNSLIDKFPGLKSESVVHDIWAFMGRNDPTGSIGLGEDDAAFLQLVKDGVYVSLGPEIGRSTRESLLRDNAKAQDNAPLKPGGVASTRKLSKDDMEDLALRAALESGGDPGKFQATMDRLKPG